MKIQEIAGVATITHGPFSSYCFAVGSTRSIPILWNLCGKFMKYASYIRLEWIPSFHSRLCCYCNHPAPQSTAVIASSPQLQTEVLKLQQQLDHLSQQLLISNQRANDCNTVSDALRQDILRLQQQLQQRDTDATAAVERAAAAAASIFAADNVAAQLRCDMVVAQAREDALKQRSEATSQRLKACEQDLNMLSHSKYLLQQEIEVLNSTHAEQRRVGNESFLELQEKNLKLFEELEAERLRAAKLATSLSTMSVSSTADADSLKEQLCAAKISAISNQDTITRLQSAALVYEQQLHSSAVLQQEMQLQVVSCHNFSMVLTPTCRLIS